MVAAAVLGGAAISGAASIFGSSKAADAQTAAAQAATANTRYMFDQTKEQLQPFISGGSNALSNLTNWTDSASSTNLLSQLMKLVTPGADQSATLEQTPGYQFSQKQGERAAMNKLASRGLGGSAGAVAKGVSDYTSGLASNTWNQVVQNLLSTFGVETNALQGMVSTGSNAAGSLAGASSNASSQINSALTGAGNAQAAAANATGSALGGVGNSLTTAALFNQLGGATGSNSIYGNGTGAMAVGQSGWSNMGTGGTMYPMFG